MSTDTSTPAPQQTPKKSFFKTKGGIFTIIGIILVILIIGFFWWWEKRQYVWTNDAQIEGFNVQVSSQIEERITRLYVDEGDIVKRGQLICELDDSVLMAQKREVEATIAQLEESIVFKKIYLEKMRDNYFIAKKEFEANVIPFLQYDHNEKDYRMAQSDLKIAIANLETGIAQLGVINANLEYTQVYAARDGVIAKRWILGGDVVQIGQPLFVLNDLKNVWVTARLEETKLEHVKVGSRVKIHIDGYPGREFHGRVFVIKAAAASQFALIPPDNATGNFTKVVQRIPIKISIDVPEGEELYLFPGMNAEVKIYIR